MTLPFFIIMTAPFVAILILLPFARAQVRDQRNTLVSTHRHRSGGR